MCVVSVEQVGKTTEDGGWKGLSQVFITSSTSSTLGNMARAASSLIPNLLAHSLPLQRLLRPKWCICSKIIRGVCVPSPKKD